jgi:5-methyltetrahydropteroyltriglutamate--homocysteine methyltransferase
MAVVSIPTEPVGSLPRPLPLIEALNTRGPLDPALQPLYEEAVAESVRGFEATGSGDH